MTPSLLCLLILASCVHADQKLKVSSLAQSAPYLMEVGLEGSEGGQYEGFIVDMLRAMDVDFQLVSPADKKYGSKNDATGKWTGMINMVLEKQADVIGADLTMSSQRAEVLDFTAPFMASDLTILTKMGGENTPDYVGLVFAPFTCTLWLLVLLAFIVTSLVFWLVSRINPQERGSTMTDSFWWIASAFVYVSRPSPNPCSKRLIVLGWWIFALIVFVAYAVGLSGFVGSTGVKFRYQNIDDMIDNPDFQFAFFKDGATHKLLKNSADPTHQEIFARANASPDTYLYSSNSNMLLEESVGGTLGIVMEGGTAKYLMPNHCDFYSVGKLATRYYGLAAEKDSPLLSDLSQKILKIQESGELQSLKNKWWPTSDCNTPSIVGNSIEEVHALDIIHLSGAFILLIVFLLVGFLTSFWELCAAIKSENANGPMSAELKEAFMGCCPKKTKAANDDAEENNVVTDEKEMKTNPGLA